MQLKSTTATNTISPLDKYLGRSFGRFVRNSSWLLIANLGASGIHFLQSLLVARWLGAEQFGVLTLVLTYNALVNGVIDLRMWETVTRYVAKFWTRQDLPRTLATIKVCYLIDAATGLLGLLVMWLITPWLATNFPDPAQATFWLRLYSLAFLAATLNLTSQAILRVFDHFSWLAWQTLGATAIQALGVFLLFLWDQLTIGALLVVLIVSELLGALLLLGITLNVIRTHLPLPLGSAPLRLLQGTYGELGQFLLGSNLTALLKTSGGYLEIPVLAHFASPAQVGYYKLAKSMVALISRIGEPFYQAIYPELAKAWSAQQRSLFFELIRKTSFLLVGLTSVIILPLMGLAPWIIQWTAGPDYLPAVDALRILAVAIGLQFIFNWLHPAALAIGRPSISNLALSMRFFVQGLSAFALVPLFGLTGMAWSTTLSTVAWIGVSLFLLQMIWRRSANATRLTGNV
jgi:O-antigen/teichoic acid export membrane protein